MRFLLLSLCLLGFALNPLHADPRNDMAIMAHAPSIKLGIGDRPGVLFVTLHNKSSATRLVGATSDAFERIELHTHETSADGMMRMVQVTDFALPANGRLALKPGGHHLMLFGFRGDKRDKEAAIEVTLNFANGASLSVSAQPMQRQKPSPHHGHHHMPHQGH